MLVRFVPHFEKTFTQRAWTSPSLTTALPRECVADATTISFTRPCDGFHAA
jgi:hypothetical protein